MLNLLTSDLTRNFALGFLAGAIVLFLSSGPAVLAATIL